MKLFTKIENWLRHLVASEVDAAIAPLTISLSREKAQIETTIKNLNDAADRITALSEFREKAELYKHIKDVESQFVAVRDTIKKLHPELVLK